MNVHTWIEFSNHNAPSCSCSCTPTASTSAATTVSSSSHPQQTRLNRDDEHSQDPDHDISGVEDDEPTTPTTNVNNITNNNDRLLDATNASFDPKEKHSATANTTTVNHDDTASQTHENPRSRKRCRCRGAPHPEASLEGIHDTLHNLLGGGGEAGKGHMASPAVAGAY